jgi:hypothetical protein
MAMETQSTPTAEAQAPIERPVLVTTAHRGVFFGYARQTDGERIKLRAARLVVRWTSEMRGFMGLANMGPSASCRIGPPADIELRNITSVSEVTADAAERFESAPWS